MVFLVESIEVGDLALCVGDTRYQLLINPHCVLIVIFWDRDPVPLSWVE